MNPSTSTKPAVGPAYLCRIRRVITIGGPARATRCPAGQPVRLPVTFRSPPVVRVRIKVVTAPATTTGTFPS